MRVLFLILLIVPLIELYFLIQVGDVIGALPTVLLTVTTALVGVALMRAQGLAIMQKAQATMASGQAPTEQMMEGVFIFLGGIFLFLPGLITDGIGFLFLIPFVRQFLIAQSLKGMVSRQSYHYSEGRGQYYEGEWSESSPKAHKVIEGEIDNGTNKDKS